MLDNQTNKNENDLQKELENLKKSEKQKNKLLLFCEVALGGVSFVSFFMLFLIYIYATQKLNIGLVSIIIIVAAFVFFFIGLFLCLYIEQKAGYYKCKKCGHKYVPTYSQVFVAPHFLRIRYMKCPHCKKRSWQKKVIE